MKQLNQTEQLQNDIAYCIDECNLSDELIGNVLRSCEELGNISAEYLMEEFVFEGGDCEKYDDINYLNIAEFNSLYWEQKLLKTIHDMGEVRYLMNIYIH